MLSHDSIWAAIDRLAEQKIADAIRSCAPGGPRPYSFNKSKRVGADGRMRWPSTESIAKVLEATGASLDQFMRYVSPEALRGSPLPQGTFPRRQARSPCWAWPRRVREDSSMMAAFLPARAGTLVEFPAAPGRNNGVYALEVQGESMKPLYRDGDILIVEPGAQVRRGDRVVVKTREGEVMAKILARQSAKSIELQSLNPDICPALST